MKRKNFFFECVVELKTACGDGDAARRAVGPDCKTAKNQMRKFVKLTGHTHIWNSLTNFQHDRKRKSSESAENSFEKAREIASSLQRIYFRRVLVNWNHCATATLTTTHRLFTEKKSEIS